MSPIAEFEPTNVSSLEDAIAPSPEIARKPGRPRDGKADLIILQATWAEVAVHGLQGFSVDKVAVRAGVSKATIYRRWATKEALVLDAWRRAEAQLTVPQTGSLIGDLTNMHEQFEAHRLDQPLMILVPQMLAAAQQNPELGEQFRAFLTDIRSPWHVVFANAQKRGEIRSDVDLKRLVMMIEGPFVLQLLIGTPITLEDGLAILNTLLEGIGQLRES
jgi:AcrR family transcriptional regulator